MPTPIPFSVAAANRAAGFSFTSPQITLPAGYGTIYWEFDIPLTADYENVLNEIDTFLLVNGSDPETVWKGGPATNKAGATDPAPAVEYDISAVPPGSTLQVKMTVIRAMKVGIKNGLVS